MSQRVCCFKPNSRLLEAVDLVALGAEMERVLEDFFGALRRLYMQRLVEYDALSVQEKKDNLYKQSLMLLLKCLKIMVNAATLSTDSQDHLLKFKKSFGSHESRMSITELTISVIKMLSVVSLKQKKSRSQKKKGCYKQSKDESLDQLFWNQEESSNHRLDSQEELSSRDGSISLQPSSCTNDIDEECLCLLSDCLLTAIHVLLALTHANDVGCPQVSGCRGLECIAELIARHFPSFSRSPLFCGMEKTGSSHQKKDADLTVQELNFLVVILAVLINLVEKDGVNRSWLASASVPITKPEGLQESEHKMIPLLCSMFLTYQGLVGKAREGRTIFNLDDEEEFLEAKKEAEKMLVATFSAMVLAFVSTESTSIRNSIKDYLPKGNLVILVPVMEDYVASLMPSDLETHKPLIEVIESCKLP